MAQSLSRLWTHLIFSTKDRFPFLTDDKIRQDMHAYLAKVRRSHDCETLVVGGTRDHVHSLFAPFAQACDFCNSQRDQANVIELD